MIRIFTTILALVLFSNAQANIVYVSTTATGQNTGQDWNNAYADFQTALDSSVNGDTIFVAQGIYLPSKTLSGDTNSLLSREFAFHAYTKNLYLFGGFSGSTSSPLERDPSIYQTILSGNIGDPTLSSDNTSLILHVENGGSQLLIDGFIFEDAFGRNSNNRFNVGIWIKTAGLRINNSIFRNIVSTSVGGNWFERCNMIIENCEFYGNRSVEASAAYFEETQAIVRNSIFHHNEATSHGGALTFNGNNLTVAGNSFVTNCLFYNNEAQGSQYGGGAVHSFGNINPVTIVNSTFANNKTAHFAGNSLYSFSANYTIHNSIFWSVDSKAHFANFQGDTVTIQNSVVKGYTGANASILTAYPLFADSTSFDFSLLSNSNAIDIGDTTGIGNFIPSLDLAGRSRYVNTIDLGAFEKQCELDTTLVLNNQTISISPTSNAQYQWVDCSTNLPVSGANNSSFTPTYSGNFACAISSPCDTMTTQCIQVCITTIADITENNGTLSVNSNQANASFQWLNCQTNSVIAGETSASFTPDATGSYACIVTTVCSSDTTDCEDVVITSVQEIETTSFKVSPNPTNYSLQIESANEIQFIEVLDLSGKVIKTPQLNLNTIDVSTLRSGVYLIRAGSTSHVYLRKFVKK